MLCSATMNESKHIIQTLKKLLRSKGVTYSRLAKVLELSEASVKRIFSEETFSLDRLGKICNVLGITIHDLANLANKNGRENIYCYTLEQERFFCNNLSCLAFFDMLLNLGSVKNIQKKFKVSQKKISFYLSSLEKLGLIERHPYDRVKLLVSNNVQWIRNGPLRKKLFDLAKAEFLNNEFDEKNSFYKFITAQISKSTHRKLLVKLDELTKELIRESELEKEVGVNVEDIGLILCSRPWKFSSLEKIC